nr:hypothetical protein [Tanacetum cinerariifolium]
MTKSAGNVNLPTETKTSLAIPAEGSNVLSEKLLDLDSTKDLHPPLHDDTLSGSTTFSCNPLLEEFADELAILSKYDDDL